MVKSLIKFFNADGMLKDSSVLFIGMAGVHVLNLLFQIVMGRTLDASEYALLITLLGIFNIFSMPLSVVGSSINRYSSLLIKEGRKGDIRRLILRWSMRMLLIGLILSFCCFIFPSQIANFFHLERTAPILIFGIILSALFCRPVFDGALTGMQCFGCWCFNSLLGWGTRLIIGSCLVLFVSSYAGWGLLGHGIGFYAAVLAGVIFLRRELKEAEPTEEALPSMQGYMTSSFFVLLGYSFLMTGDVVLVKHLYPEQAGDFSYAATLGRLVIFIPQAFVAAMFPKVVSEDRGTVLHRNLYYKTLLMTLLTTVLAAIVFTFAINFLLGVIYGISDPSVDLVRWSRMLAWIMIPVALLSVSVRFALAQNIFGCSVIVPVCGVAYIASAFLLRNGVDFMLFALSILSITSLIVIITGISMSFSKK